MLQFLQHLTTLQVIQPAKTILTPAEQPFVDDGYFKDKVDFAAVRISFDELHIRNFVKVNPIVQIGDCQIIILEIGMGTRLVVGHACASL
jgi:hypothetical protein